MNQRIIAEIDQHDMKAVLKPADEYVEGLTIVADRLIVSVRANHLYKLRCVVLKLEHDREGMRKRATPVPEPQGSGTVWRQNLKAAV